MDSQINGGLEWSDFNVDFHSEVQSIKQPKFAQIAEKESRLNVDLRPYMVPRPYTVYENDSIQKCLNLFRLMNLRQLPVLNEDDGSIVGIITRQDLFAFMTV